MYIRSQQRVDVAKNRRNPLYVSNASCSVPSSVRGGRRELDESNFLSRATNALDQGQCAQTTETRVVDRGKGNGPRVWTNSTRTLTTLTSHRQFRTPALLSRSSPSCSPVALSSSPPKHTTQPAHPRIHRQDADNVALGHAEYDCTRPITPCCH
jgi:hypothetical protein